MIIQRSFADTKRKADKIWQARLLIAGGGTIGTYTASELHSLGFEVDIICKNDPALDVPGINYRIDAVFFERLKPDVVAEISKKIDDYIAEKGL